MVVLHELKSSSQKHTAGSSLKTGLKGENNFKQLLGGWTIGGLPSAGGPLAQHDVLSAPVITRPCSRPKRDQRLQRCDLHRSRASLQTRSNRLENLAPNPGKTCAKTYQTLHPAEHRGVSALSRCLIAGTFSAPARGALGHLRRVHWAFERSPSAGQVQVFRPRYPTRRDEIGEGPVAATSNDSRVSTKMAMANMRHMRPCFFVFFFFLFFFFLFSEIACFFQSHGSGLGFGRATGGIPSSPPSRAWRKSIRDSSVL